MNDTQSSIIQSNSTESNFKSETKTNSLDNDWTNLPQTHPLHLFSLALGGPEGILERAGWKEMYGVELVAGNEECVSYPLTFTQDQDDEDHDGRSIDRKIYA